MTTETDTETGQKSVATVTGKQAPLKPRAVPDIDPENPPEEFADALEAEDFIVYGKASIEKFDDGGQNSDVPEKIDLSPDAIEGTLDRFFNSEKAPGIISIGHDDIPVGRPLREFELPEETAIEVGGETFEFDAGDTITTHVEDADGDDRPELWLVADLAKDTEIARKARLGVLAGELDGFSVTFGRRKVENEGEGRKVTEYDLFSVTLAPDDMIANKGAEFDLAAFKAQMNSYLPTARGDDATDGFGSYVAEQLARGFRQTMSDTDIDEDTLLTKLGQKLTGGDGDQDEQEAGESTADDAGQKEEDDEGDGNTVEDLVNALAAELDADPDDLMQALGQAADDEDEEEEDEDDEDEGGMKADEDTESDDTEDFGAKLEEHGVVTEDDLGEKLDSLQETIVEDVGAKLAETNQEAVEEIAQKMESGSTPNPAGGSFQDEQDFDEHLQEVAEKEGY